MSATGYSKRQVWLHWGLAVLMILQFVLHEGIHEIYDRVTRGEDVPAAEMIPANAHVAFGFLIWCLAAYRLWVRYSEGTPPAPASEPAPLRFIAHATHYVLYAIMLVMPISGAVAWFGGVEAAAEAHGLGKIAMIVFIGLHVAGAIYQHFVVKSDVLRRMTRPEGEPH